MKILSAVLFGLALLLLLWGVVIFNALVARRNQVRNAWRQIDVQLKRRHDLIPNLVEVVKDYLSYEQETLRQVIEARSGAVKASGARETLAAEQVLTGALGRLFALMENYPELKADGRVSQLMEELSSTENMIAFARQFYNDSVMELNNTIESVPSNIVAGLFGFSLAVHFEAPEAALATPSANLR